MRIRRARGIDPSPNSCLVYPNNIPMKELTTEEMTTVQGGSLSASAGAGALSGAKAISVGNVALALNVDVNVLSGNGSGGGLNTLLLATAKAGTVSFNH